MAYREAWLKAIDEYNAYGFAAHDARYRIDKTQAGLMLGFKVWL